MSPGLILLTMEGSQVLPGEIIRNASGKNMDEFSNKYLFDPLKINDADWAVNHDNGVIEAAGGLKLTPRGMLKFGIRYLNNDQWKGQQIISQDWVLESSINFLNFSIDVPGTDGKNLGYGYTWWIPHFTVNGKILVALEAGGWGGQKIFIIPELNMVVVFAGGNYTSKTKQFTIMRKFIFPAIVN